MSTSPVISDQVSTANSAPPANVQPPVAPAPVTAQTSDQTQNSPAATTSAAGETAARLSQPPQQPNVTVTQPQATQSANPSVRRAGWLRAVAETLSGGPRVTYTIDPVTGQSKPTPVPVSNRKLGLAIAMEALAGGLTGLGQNGPDAAGKAAAAGVQQGMALEAQRQAQQQAQAQNDYQNQSLALVRKAQAFESNSRAILNTRQAERMGIESLKDAVSQNADLLQGYNDQGAVTEEHVLQDDLLSQLQAGEVDFHSMIAIPDGWTNVPGHGYEQTFAIVGQPSAKVLLTQQMVDNLASAHVPGFPAGMKVPTNGYPVPGSILANANQRAQANRQMLDEASDISRTLAKSSDPATKALASQIPDIGKLLDDPQNGLALQSALPKLQKYLHHDGSGDTFYQGLVAMAQPQRPNPTNPKQMISNTTDSQAAQVIAGAFGNGDPTQGWKVLQAYHTEITPAPIKSESEAEGILSDQASTPRQKAAARQFLNLANQQKAAQATVEARAKASAELANTTDVPTLGEALAKGEITEDQIPGFSKLKPQIQAYLAQHHPNLDQSSLQLTSEERKRKDLAKNAINNLNIIQGTLQRRPDLLGIVQGRVSQGKGLVGTGDPDLTAVNTALDNYALAATGAHGIRAVEARASAKQALLNGFKNGAAGVNSAINTAKQSLQEFANLGKPRGLDGSLYVYKTGPQSGPTPGQHVVPAGATPGRDAKGNIIGYRTADGQVVRF